MKQLVTSIMVSLISFSSFGQTDEAYNQAIESFQNYYNVKQYDSIYGMFSDNMKQLITPDVLKMQMDSFHELAGEFEAFSLLKSLPKGKIFKVTHKKNIWEYQMTLNDENMITGLKPQPHTSPDVKVIERNTTKMIVPFKDEWYVFWGGTDVVQNYHVAHENQKYAYDILMEVDGSTHKGDSKNNESYYVFGKDIIAPCDGKIVQIITGVHDNIPGELNPGQLTGNTVVIETGLKEYIMFAHLKQGSIVVKEGQKVKRGELLGQCGNSGNTTEAHLHISLQNQVELFGATGGKLFFEKILVNGEIKEDYIPVKGDRIKNIEN